MVIRIPLLRSLDKGLIQKQGLSKLHWSVVDNEDKQRIKSTVDTRVYVWYYDRGMGNFGISNFNER